VQVFGAKDYAMRIWLKPDRLAQLKLSPGDIVRALNEQNAQFAAGKVGEPPTGGGQELVYTITTKGRLSEPKEFETSSCARIPTARACAWEMWRVSSSLPATTASWGA
jgi:multidrug efflux pump subunit AcrB